MPIDSKTRCEIIEHSINLETILSTLITNSFFSGGPIRLKFFHGVLGDANANTAFKVSVFSKCFPAFPKKHIERCRRLFNIRNIFAHCGTEITNIVDPDKSGILDPKDLEKPLDIDALAREFSTEYAIIVDELFKLMESEGVQLDKAL